MPATGVVEDLATGEKRGFTGAEELLAILGAGCPGWSKMLSGTSVGQPEDGDGRREVSQ